LLGRDEAAFVQRGHEVSLVVPSEIIEQRSPHIRGIEPALPVLVELILDVGGELPKRH